jgi:hypothetical protein
MQGRYHTGQHKRRTNADRHPCLEGNSNLRSQCLSGRGHFMPLTARPLFSAPISNIIYTNISLIRLFQYFVWIIYIWISQPGHSGCYKEQEHSVQAGSGAQPASWTVGTACCLPGGEVERASSSPLNLPLLPRLGMAELYPHLPMRLHDLVLYKLGPELTLLLLYVMILGAGIAYWVQRLATGWTTEGSKFVSR